jgi:hypothetical protein
MESKNQNGVSTMESQAVNNNVHRNKQTMVDEHSANNKTNSINLITIISASNVAQCSNYYNQLRTITGKAMGSSRVRALGTAATAAVITGPHVPPSLPAYCQLLSQYVCSQAT